MSAHDLCLPVPSSRAAAAPPAVRSLSIVIPCFNEAARLPPTLERLRDFVRERGVDAEILVVDDGSLDETAAVARAFLPRMPVLRVLRNEVNRGKGFAVRTGVLAATRETILFTDVDLSTPIEEIDRLWPLYDEGWDLLIGSRHLSRADVVVRQPAHRRLFGKVFNLIVSLLGIRGFRDTQCGFKMFRGPAARTLFSRLRTDGFAFDVEILMDARRRGFRIAEVPVQWFDAAGTRVRLVRDSIRMFLEILKIRGFLRARPRP